MSVIFLITKECVNVIIYAAKYVGAFHMLQQRFVRLQYSEDAV
jgi:hypothetical protein